MESKKTDRKDKRRDGKFYDSAVNANIRQRLQDLGWTAADLRRSLQENGLSLSGEAVRQWVSGYSQPKLDNIPIVSEVLGCSVNYLFGGTNIRSLKEESVTVADLDFPESAISQLVNRHKIPDSGNIVTGNEKDLQIRRTYKLFVRIIGKPEFWSFLDCLHNYIAANISSWRSATIDLPNNEGKIIMDASRLRDILWADCTDPLRKIVDETMLAPDDGGDQNVKEKP